MCYLSLFILQDSVDDAYLLDQLCTVGDERALARLAN